MTSCGVLVVCREGGAMLFSVGIASLFGGCFMLDGVLTSVLYDVRICTGSSFSCMYAFQEG
jgi:hypothetical protein